MTKVAPGAGSESPSANICRGAGVLRVCGRVVFSGLGSEHHARTKRWHTRSLRLFISGVSERSFRRRRPFRRRAGTGQRVARIIGSQ